MAIGMPDHRRQSHIVESGRAQLFGVSTGRHMRPSLLNSENELRLRALRTQIRSAVRLCRQRRNRLASADGVEFELNEV